MSENDLSRISAARKCLYERSRRSPLNIALNAVIVVFCVVLVLELSFNLFFTGIYVIDVSMTPTFTGAKDKDTAGGDFIYVDKYASPGYGDIVVVYRETYDNQGNVVAKGNIIKRAIAFGGDVVELKNGELYINGERREESYLDGNYNTSDKPVNTFAAHTVAEGCMFLLGDNRDVSNDSRQNGDYPVKNTVGVVPHWAMSIKAFTTKTYTFFNFSIWGK